MSRLRGASGARPGSPSQASAASLEALPRAEQLRAVFNSIDVDLSGFLSKRELLLAVRGRPQVRRMLDESPAMRPLLKPRSFDAAVEIMDANKDGLVSLAEFVDAVEGTLGVECGSEDGEGNNEREPLELIEVRPSCLDSKLAARTVPIDSNAALAVRRQDRDRERTGHPPPPDAEDNHWPAGGAVEMGDGVDPEDTVATTLAALGVGAGAQLHNGGDGGDDDGEKEADPLRFLRLPGGCEGLPATVDAIEQRALLDIKAYVSWVSSEANEVQVRKNAADDALAAAHAEVNKWERLVREYGSANPKGGRLNVVTRDREMMVIQARLRLAQLVQRDARHMMQLLHAELADALEIQVMSIRRREVTRELVNVNVRLRQAADVKALALLEVVREEAQRRDELERWRLGAASAKTTELWMKLDAALPDVYARIVVAANALEAHERSRALQMQVQVWEWAREKRAGDESMKLIEEVAFLHHKVRDHRARLPEIHTAQATAVIRDDYALAQKLKQDEADLLLAMQHIEETLAEVRRQNIYIIFSVAKYLH